MFDRDPITGHSSLWFVYLLPLSDDTGVDGSSFKIGFSCNPLQRLHSFNRRYFERFDLQRAALVGWYECERARRIESALKAALAQSRIDSPPWVAPQAGGHTEWFAAERFSDAERMLRQASEQASSAWLPGTTFVGNELTRAADAFELWAVAQARRLHDDVVAVSLGYAALLSATVLRDWLDAYQHFNVQIFADDPTALSYVRSAARNFAMA
jgi:hypothetical protein